MMFFRRLQQLAQVTLVLIVAFTAFQTQQGWKRADYAFLSFQKDVAAYDVAIKNLQLGVDKRAIFLLEISISSKFCKIQARSFQLNVATTVEVLSELSDSSMKGIVAETVVPFSSPVRLQEYYLLLAQLPKLGDALETLQQLSIDSWLACDLQGDSA